MFDSCFETNKEKQLFDLVIVVIEDAFRREKRASPKGRVGQVLLPSQGIKTMSLSVTNGQGFQLERKVISVKLSHIYEPSG